MPQGEPARFDAATAAALEALPLSRAWAMAAEVIERTAAIAEAGGPPATLAPEAATAWAELRPGERVAFVEGLRAGATILRDGVAELLAAQTGGTDG
jgi:hypothetical protein